jgi:DNA-binding response OmpR family regulator
MGTQRDPTFLQALLRRLAVPDRMRVLIVDPDLAGARALAEALRRQHVTTVVGSFAGAVACIEAERPTLVVTELRLPDASGLDLLATLHTRPATRHVLLMALTSHASVRDKIAAFQAGADDCLVKPIEPSRFAFHVERLSRFRQVLPPSAS